MSKAKRVKKASMSTQIWDDAVKRFNAALEAEEEDEESYELCAGFMGNVGIILSDTKKLSQETAVMWDYMDGEDVRGLSVSARIYSVDGQNCVDVKHEYHHRCRYDSVEHKASLHFKVSSPATNATDQQTDWDRAWTVSLRATGTRDFCYAEKRIFSVTSSSIKSIRKALFPEGSENSGISAKLTDYALMTWILAAAGYNEAKQALPADLEVKHSTDRWEGVNLRASTAEDADWKEADFDAEIERRKMDERADRDDALMMMGYYGTLHDEDDEDEEDLSDA